MMSHGADPIVVAQADRWLTTRSELAHRCRDLTSLPSPHTLEIAFIGRSNVGKSSLINALLKRRNLATTSRTPGCTRRLDFIAVGDEHTYLIDLPGYGYARVGKHRRSSWKKMIFDFARARPNLRRALLLVDSRHGIVTADHEAMGMFNDAAVTFQLVLTKADKASDNELKRTLAMCHQALANSPAGNPKVMVTSIRNKSSVDELRLNLWQLRCAIVDAA